MPNFSILLEYITKKDSLRKKRSVMNVTLSFTPDVDELRCSGTNH